MSTHSRNFISSSSSQEIRVTFTEYIRLWFDPSNCDRAENYFKFHIVETLGNPYQPVFINLRLSLTGHNGFWEFSLQPLGKKYIQNLSMLLQNSTTLNFLSCDSCSQGGFVTERIHKKQLMTCFNSSLVTNFISNYRKVHMLHVHPTFVHLRLLSFVQSVSKIQHNQTAFTLFRRFKIKLRLQYFRLPSAQPFT